MLGQMEQRAWDVKCSWSSLGPYARISTPVCARHVWFSFFDNTNSWSIYCYSICNIPLFFSRPTLVLMEPLLDNMKVKRAAKMPIFLFPQICYALLTDKGCQLPTSWDKSQPSRWRELLPSWKKVEIDFLLISALSNTSFFYNFKHFSSFSPPYW